MFLTPLLLKYVFLISFIDLRLVYYGDVLEDIFFVLSVLSVLYSGILKKQFLLSLLYTLYALYFVLETTSYLAVSSNFTSSYMYLLIESNKFEMKEFMYSYLNLKVVVFFVLMVIFFFLIRKRKVVVQNRSKVVIGISLFLGIVFFLKVTGFIEENAYHNIVRGTYGYFELQNKMQFDAEIKKEDVKITSNNEVLVVVLGESTTRGHMQLYGYERETSPLLDSLKDSLYVYNNVISSEVLTLKSIPKMLTSIDGYSMGTKGTNIIQVFNKAGYKSFWLSNQRPISYHDNAINKIASSSSNKVKFYNHKVDKHATRLDEIMFQDYLSLLKQPGKKIIFLRLIGTHFDYKNRYPEHFNKFLSDKNVSKKEKIVNEYDNAVLYNDFIVYSLIKELQGLNQKSALLYLSDHGENIYHEGTDFFGRSEKILTKSMFEIPFILWTSKSFEFPSDFEYVPERSFVADDAYESIGHIFGVKHKDMDASKSVFSKFYQGKKRIVLGSWDYDSLRIE